MTTPAAPLPSAFPPPGPLVHTLRVAFALSGRLAPGLAARAAEAVFCRPPAQTPRPQEDAFLAQATTGRVLAGGQPIVTYTWPGDGPTVLLMHGWGSYAGRWRTIGEALRTEGFRLVALDAPAHGNSPGTRASLPEFARALSAVQQSIGEVHGIVGHSLGASAIPVGLAYKGLATPRAVLLAPPASPISWADQMGEYLWWTDEVKRRMIARLEAYLGHAWTDFEIPELVRERREPALLIHDRDDTDVPPDSGRAIAAAWPGARLVETTGLGHRAIMRDPAVAAHVVEFLRS